MDLILFSVCTGKLRNRSTQGQCLLGKAYDKSSGNSNLLAFVLSCGARPRAPQQRPRDCATRLCTLAECAGGRDLPRVRHLRRPWVLAASGRVEERHQDGGRLPSRRYSRSCGPGRGPAEPDEGWWWVCLPPFICWLVCVVWRQVVTCSVRRRHCWCQRRTGNAHGDHAADD